MVILGISKSLMSSSYNNSYFKLGRAHYAHNWTLSLFYFSYFVFVHQHHVDKQQSHTPTIGLPSVARVVFSGIRHLSTSTPIYTQSGWLES
jgi:hypothetical protein